MIDAFEVDTAPRGEGYILKYLKKDDSCVNSHHVFSNEGTDLSVCVYCGLIKD